jgi:hypothetical protein
VPARFLTGPAVRQCRTLAGLERDLTFTYGREVRSYSLAIGSWWLSSLYSIRSKRLIISSKRLERLELEIHPAAVAALTATRIVTINGSVFCRKMGCIVRLLHNRRAADGRRKNLRVDFLGGLSRLKAATPQAKAYASTGKACATLRAGLKPRAGSSVTPLPLNKLRASFEDCFGAVMRQYRTCTARRATLAEPPKKAAAAKIGRPTRRVTHQVQTGTSRRPR